MIKDIIADHFSGNPQAGCRVTYPESRLDSQMKGSICKRWATKQQSRIYSAEAPPPTNTKRTIGSVSWFRLFEMQEVHVAADVTGHDEIEGVRKCAAIRRDIARECGENLSYFQVPYLYCVIRAC